MEPKHHNLDGMFEPSEQIAETLPLPADPAIKLDMKQVYDPELLLNLNRLRYLIAKGELSPRGFALSGMIISGLKNHYAAWVYRREYLLANRSVEAFRTELAFCTEAIKEEPKGFQSWEHRRFCIDGLNSVNYDEERDFLKHILDLDLKNYHAWAFRVWMTQRFGLFESELPWATALLILNLDNNSIWSYRKFLSGHLKLGLKEEEDFVYPLIADHPKIESAWYYLDHLYEAQGQFSERLKQFCLDLAAAGKQNRFSLAFTIFNEHRREAQHQDLALVSTCLAQLKTTYDPMRKEYWLFFEQRFATSQAKA